jgi:uncharacterized protein
MRFNVAQLLKEQSGQTRQHTLREDISRIDPDIIPLSTLDGNIQMIRTADGVLVLGQLHASVELVCSRCLDEFSLPLQFNLEGEFRSTIDVVTGAALPISEEDDAATQIDDHHELDLSEVVRQDILLTLPPNPICRTKCLGLCPTCGKNWNERSCDCQNDEIDPRWQSLKKLLDKEKKE